MVQEFTVWVEPIPFKLKDDNRIGANGTANWNVLNLMWSKQFNKIQFQLGALNLLNEKYKTHGSGIYGMGRTYSVQIKVSY